MSELSNPNNVRRALTLLQRAAGAQPVADDILTFQHVNQAEWKALSALATFDHGLLAGLGDDDHAQYALADKTRPAPWVAAGDLAGRSIADLGTRDHDLLAGLGDDDHTQYALLAGRAGGQTLIGGTAASEDLTLQSTSHATRGSVYFGSAAGSEYDEANDRWGFFVAPSLPFQVGGAFTAGSRAVDISPGINVDVGSLRNVTFYGNVESNNNGIGAIAYSPKVMPGANMGQGYGIIGMVRIDRAQDDLTSYNVTDFYVNFYRADLLANYGSTITRLYGLHVANATIAGAGVITTQYGVYIASLTAAWTNWAFYSSSGTTPSFFGGPVRIHNLGVPSASAAIDIDSTTRALVLSRMTTVQRNAIAAPVNGMIIYNTTTGAIEGREGGAWVNL